MISDRAMLAKDGGLQYRHDKIKDLDLSKDDIVQLRNVIGLAKTFKPTSVLGTGRKRQSLGNLTKGLKWKERTAVIRPTENKDTTCGWWYLRLRPTDWMYSPLQGIVKIEVFATGEEKDDGISKYRADTISSYVLAERNVTPYKADARWATHIYPIFLTETYLRSSFLSHTRFKSLIFLRKEYQHAPKRVHRKGNGDRKQSNYLHDGSFLASPRYYCSSFRHCANRTYLQDKKRSELFFRHCERTQL